MQALDRSLFLYFNGLHSPASDVFWLLMTNNWTWVAFFIPVGYLVFNRYGKQGFWVALCVPLLFLLADQGTNLAKFYFMRPRPCRAEELQGLVHFIAPRCSLYGFWSAHAANATAQIVFFMAIGLVKRPRRRYVYPLFILFALTVSFSRIMVGVHYPGDILTGAAYGALCGLAVYGLYVRFLRKRLTAADRHGNPKNT